MRPFSVRADTACGGSRNDSSMRPFVFVASTVDDVSRRPMIRPLSFDTVMSPAMSSSSRRPSSLSTSTEPVIPRTTTVPDPSIVSGRSAGIAIVYSTLHQIATNTGHDARTSSTPPTTRLDTLVACQPLLTSAVISMVSPSVAVIDTDPLSLLMSTLVTSTAANDACSMCSSWASRLTTLYVPQHSVPMARIPPTVIHSARTILAPFGRDPSGRSIGPRRADPPAGGTTRLSVREKSRGGRVVGGAKAGVNLGGGSSVMSSLLHPLQDGEHPAVVVGGRRKVELREDVADVLLDGLVADHELAGDRRVRSALRHQVEHLALAGGQSLQRVVAAAAGEQLRDDLRVEHRSSVGHLAH